MFADRLSEIMKTLDVNNKQLAEYAQLDSSSLSRLTKGSRIPSRESVTVAKIVSGLILYCEDSQKTGSLCSLTGLPTATDHEELSSSLLNWLFMDHPMTTKHSGQKSSDDSRTAINRSARKKFGTRFNNVMELAGISNITLSRKSYMDPSVISRYRSGLRSPIKNSEAAELLSSIIYNEIEETGKISDLSLLMGESPESIDESLFSRWLYADALHRDMDVTYTEKLLTAFESFTLSDDAQTETPLDLLAKEETDKSREYYAGSKGLCDAVIRFLSGAVKTRAKELYLFSNQSMSWMTGDPSFLIKWAALMKACISNGTRIIIIHNIDRTYEEMNSAIIAWLPLYMSGRITPYYCTLPTGSLFSQTLFINPGQACIIANLVSGTENSGLYYYCTKEPFLSFMQTQFSTMLSHSRPLVDILPAGAADISDFAGSEDLRIIQPSLSLMSMPESAARSFDSAQLMDVWNSYNNLSRVLKNKRVFECAPLCDPEVLETDKPAVEAVPGIPDMYYTKDSYRKHISNIISNMNSRPGYIFVDLPEAPFSNIQLIISDEHVRITRTAPPFISFTFTHSQMCHAFKSYSDNLIRQYLTGRRTMINKLNELFL
ncbi:MAG: hypothetical protein K6E91_05445 [Butyrivibrio sp.]|nr:hypothetical protein [Butyrivibrio sp.]